MARKGRSGFDVENQDDFGLFSQSEGIVATANNYWNKFSRSFSSIPKQVEGSENLEDIESLSKNPNTSSFIVLGINIGSWTATSQYVFCTFGVMVFLLSYGLLQELVVMKTFNRGLGWFVTLLQLSGYSICAWVQSCTVGDKIIRRIPYRQYAILASLQVVMQGFTNLSMHYLNYPTKTLFKSSRVIVTMIVGILVRRKKYKRMDYVVAVSMAFGLTTFVLADAKSSPQFDLKGVFFISIALAADGAILNLQEICLKTYNATHDELVYFSYLGASGIVFMMTLYTGFYDLSSFFNRLRLLTKLSNVSFEALVSPNFYFNRFFRRFLGGLSIFALARQYFDIWHVHAVFLRWFSRCFVHCGVDKTVWSADFRYHIDRTEGNDAISLIRIFSG